MKKVYFLRTNVLLSILAVFFMISQAAAQSEYYTGAKDPNSSIKTAEKPIQDYSHKYLPPSGREGGEVIASAISIPALPFNDSGNTCDNVNNYDVSCPYTGSVSPDVVYSYTPAENQIINIDLCGSTYDTKVYVYENTEVSYACNDDYYVDAACGVYVSAILSLSVTGGNTYYIIVDGYGGDCGDYLLLVDVVPPPPECSACLICSIPEGEPDIPDYGPDLNSGCNSFPVVTTPIELNQVICGRANTYYNYGDFRDTDWYEITLTEAGTLYWSGYAMFSLQLYILNSDCNNLTQYAGGTTSECSPVSISADLPAGTYYLWAGPSFFTGLPVAQNYTVMATFNAPPLEGFCPEPVPVSNWPLFMALGLIALLVTFRFWRMR